MVHTRCLTPEEIALLRTVFGDTIPYGRVTVTSDLGLGGTPWTLWTGSGWNVNLGPQFFHQTLQNDGCAILVHELTHVWESAHSLIPLGQVLDSLHCQFCHSRQNCPVMLGRPWSAYNSEQKAAIVESWFRRGCEGNDPAFPYIRRHIWAGKNA